MRLFVTSISALALMTAGTGAAQAQAAAHAHPHAQASVASTAQSDERCLLAMVALSNAGNDQNSRSFGQAGVIYFTGRLARDPSFDFGRLKSLVGTMDTKEVQADLQEHCAPEFESSIQHMQAALVPPKAAAQPPVAAPPPAPVEGPTAPPVMELPH